MLLFQFSFVLVTLNKLCNADDDHDLAKNRRSFMKYMDEVSDASSEKHILQGEPIAKPCFKCRF